MRALQFIYVAFLLALLPIASLADAGPARAQAGDELTALNAEVVRLHAAGKYSEANPLAERAVALAERLHGPDHPNVGTALNNLGLLYRAQERNAEAEPIYKRYLAIREKTLGPDHPNVATALNNIAVMYKAQGRYRDCLLYTSDAADE